jgi:hypothetical protein
MPGAVIAIQTCLCVAARRQAFGDFLGFNPDEIAKSHIPYVVHASTIRQAHGSARTEYQ